MQFAVGSLNEEKTAVSDELEFIAKAAA